MGVGSRNSVGGTLGSDDRVKKKKHGNSAENTFQLHKQTPFLRILFPWGKLVHEVNGVCVEFLQRCSLFVVRCSLFVVRCSWFVVDGGRDWNAGVPACNAVA